MAYCKPAINTDAIIRTLHVKQRRKTAHAVGDAEDECSNSSSSKIVRNRRTRRVWHAGASTHQNHPRDILTVLKRGCPDCEVHPVFNNNNTLSNKIWVSVNVEYYETEEMCLCCSDSHAALRDGTAETAPSACIIISPCHRQYCPFTIIVVNKLWIKMCILSGTYY